MNDNVEIEKAAQILKLLGDKTRLAMMKVLQESECCVCEFVALFQMSQPAVSQHLRKLKDLDVVREKRKGQWIFYSINPESPFHELISTILDQLPSQRERMMELEHKGLRIICE